MESSQSARAPSVPRQEIPPGSGLTEADLRFHRSYRWRRSFFWYEVMGRLVLMPFYHFYLGFQAIGKERWRRGPLIVIANHLSNLDAFAVSIARPFWGPYQVSWLNKIESFRNPIARFLLVRLGSFPFIRQMTDVRGVRTVMELLKRGEIVGIFPEGTRSRTGEVGPFDPGFVRMAVQMRAPILLAAIANTDKALPPGARFPRPRIGIKVWIDGPVELSEYYGQKLSEAEIVVIAERLRQRIIDLRKQMA